MNFIAAGLSDVGLQRQHNEDSYCILSEHRLFIVADGMGGHRAGDLASQMATHTIANFFELAAHKDMTWPFSFDPSISVDENKLITGIKLANQQIFETSVRHPEVQGMGTTVVGAVFSEDKKNIYIAHVGDSRLYRIRDGEIEQLTRDHSLINDYLLIMPHLTDEQKQELPSNVITRALGMQEAVPVDLRLEDVQGEDTFVLCSDGLNGMIDDDEIRDITVEAGYAVEDAAMELVRRANEEGGEDNVTVLVVKAGGQG